MATQQDYPSGNPTQDAVVAFVAFVTALRHGNTEQQRRHRDILDHCGIAVRVKRGCPIPLSYEGAVQR